MCDYGCFNGLNLMQIFMEASQVHMPFVVAQIVEVVVAAVEAAVGQVVEGMVDLVDVVVGWVGVLGLAIRSIVVAPKSGWSIGDRISDGIGDCDLNLSKYAPYGLNNCILFGVAAGICILSLPLSV
ncbi:hypothetical protein G9A89_009603 [Geosiphon pyriformis]|nr:hypothetical protein G9A89_009603 [Geosiphon pyriformis]